jgi:hypothetical protein
MTRERVVGVQWDCLWLFGGDAEEAKLAVEGSSARSTYRVDDFTC